MSFFPSAPGYRMALEADGSVLFHVVAGTPDYPGSSTADALNSEARTDAVTIDERSGVSYAGWLFPELRDVEGYFLAWSGDGAPENLQISTDTTNGADGTWTTVVGGTVPAEPISPYVNGMYRSGAQTLSETGVVGIRVTSTSNVTLVWNFHVYGVPHSGANPDRLEIWDPSSDIKLGIEALDPGTGGDVQRGQSYTRTFRVKNLSSTMTATDTVVAAGIATDNSLSVLAGINFDIGGGPAPTVTIATLAPGAISSVITMTYDVAANAQVHTANFWVEAVPSSYS